MQLFVMSQIASKSDEFSQETDLRSTISLIIYKDGLFPQSHQHS